MRLTGGDVLARMIHAHGVRHAFGMGGFQLLPYYEGVRRLGLPHVLVNDERTAAFAADASARITGIPAVVDATLGPGATNLVTGLAESINAGVPLIALTGDAHRAFAHRNMTQETRQVEILRPVAKELIRVENVERIPEFIRRAFLVATSGRAGPVVVDVPEDVAHGEAEFSETDLASVVQHTAPAIRCRPDSSQVERAARMLSAAERPVILAGGGVHLSGAQAALQRLAQGRQIPVAHTISGKGAIACTDPLSLGIFGRYDRIANEVIAASDCLLVVGCKLGEIATKRYTVPPPTTPLIHLDIEPLEIGRWRRADVALWGDARSGLEDLDACMTSSQDRHDYLRELAARHAQWRQGAAARYSSREIPINIARVMGELNRAMPDDGVLVTDGGFASHWAGLLFDTRRAGRFLIAGRGMASIGYGLPASMGAQLASPGRRVVGVTGDGGFNMVAGDLETARRAGANFVLVILNNAASGYIKALQHAVYGPGSYQSSDLSELDYAAVARAYGCHGIRVREPDELAAALREGLANVDGPTVIDVAVTRDPAAMLPGIDSRTLQVRPGDRPA